MPVILRWTEKDAAEICVVSLDFTPALAVGETVVSATAAVFTNTSPPVASTDIAVLGMSVSGNVAAARISGGVAGTDYLVKITATTSQSNVLPRAAQLLCGVTS